MEENGERERKKNEKSEVARQGEFPQDNFREIRSSIILYSQFLYFIGGVN